MTPSDPETTPPASTTPPRNERGDTIARSASAEAREALLHPDAPQGAAVFTKGDNAPTLNQVGLPYTTEDLNRPAHGPAAGADQPGGSGATPLAADRNEFMHEIERAAGLDSLNTARHWTEAIFNTLRALALEHDPATTTTLLAEVTRAGEAPDVALKEMLWGGDYVRRMARLLEIAADQVSEADLLQRLTTMLPDVPAETQVRAALQGLFQALASRLGADERTALKLGALQQLWDTAGA